MMKGRLSRIGTILQVREAIHKSQLTTEFKEPDTAVVHSLHCPSNPSHNGGGKAIQGVSRITLSHLTYLAIDI